MGKMNVTFLGVRGSYPVSGSGVARVGGNSSSLRLESGGAPFFLDAGSGIIAAGEHLLQQRDGGDVHIFLTHLHFDHIMGLPFFAPVFSPRFHLHLHAPRNPAATLQNSIESLFMPPFSPITLAGIRASLTYHEYDSAAPYDVRLDDAVRVRACMNHDGDLLGVAVYRVETQKGSMVYATDVEAAQGFRPPVHELALGTDVLIHDSQYLVEDYDHPTSPKRGFGHSTFEMAARNAVACQVGRLYLFHFDPHYRDATLRRMLHSARTFFPRTFLAREQQQFTLRS
jgi:ribonuclease BN (tRNA processing enzyme)